MGWSQWALVSACVEVLLYGAFVAILVIAGRRTDARAQAGFVPDRVVLVRRLLGDFESRAGAGRCWSRSSPTWPPSTSSPDFIPVAGRLDDAIILALLYGPSYTREAQRAGGPAA